MVLAIELLIATLGSGLKVISSPGAEFDPAFGSPEQIGELLLTDFLLAFEVASYLLLVAAVGAVMLARRRRGLPGAEEPRRARVLRRPPPRLQRHDGRDGGRPAGGRSGPPRPQRGLVTDARGTGARR